MICQVASDTPDALVGDPNRLRQVIINLVGNAVKFTDSGEVIIRVETKSLGESHATFHFSISDTGIGISLEKQAAIFEAFTQADGSATRKYGGTGLGLTISLRLVELMGGSLWVESEPGRGSTFHFTAALGLQSSQGVRPVAETTAGLSNLRVLIVDDNAALRRFLQETLADRRMNIASVEGGQAALDAIRRANEEARPFDLLLLDACLPEMDGFSVVEQIKQAPKCGAATVMMLSSLSLESDSARCKQLGVSAYVVKPVLQPDLLETIATVTSAHKMGKRNDSMIARQSPMQGKDFFHVLIAEDNSINQKLAATLLKKRGHSVVVAASGRETLAAIERERFDLVLMDVQMPDIDGLRATAIIRERERLSGEHLPIIAMTAHAMKGDRERCLEAGMDNYLSKPMRTKELFEAIENLVSRSTEKAEAREANPELTSWVTTMEQFYGDREYINTIIETFIESSDESIMRMQIAIRKSDDMGLMLAARSLKAALSGFYSTEAIALASELEMIGREGNLARASTVLASLEDKIERLKPDLLTFKSEK
jgi:CheY-like chemotaxis protein/HPt (histidine-containing phosphotransfer) domain-containing protein